MLTSAHDAGILPCLCEPSTQLEALVQIAIHRLIQPLASKEIVMKSWSASTNSGAFLRDLIGLSALFWMLSSAAPALAQRPDTQDELEEAEEEETDEEEEEREIGKWYPTLETGLSLTQSAYSDNWNGGDTGSLSWAAFINSTAEQQTSTKFNWWNSMKLAYGQTHLQSRQENGDLSWDAPDKSTDLIDLESIGRFTLGGWLDPYIALRGESQFQDLSDPFGRDVLFNPIKIRESAGVAHPWHKEGEHSVISRLGASARQNFRQSFIAELDPSNEETELDVTQDAGIEFVTDARLDILEDKVKWTSRLGIYQPLFYSEKGDFEDLASGQLAAAGLDSDLADFTTTVDMEWENMFSTKITKIISVGLYLRWIYDVYDNSVKPEFDGDGNLTNFETVGNAVRKSGQFKQTLAIGLSYSFI